MRERSVLGLVACAVVGCNSDQGAVLELEPSDPRTSYVQLFVAERLCDDCTGITPPLGDRKLTGDVWFLDDAAMFIAPVTDGHARFLFVPDANNDIPLIEAIGFDAAGVVTENATLHGLTVPRDNVQLWQQRMHAIAPLLPIASPFDGGTAVGAMLWARPNDPAPGTMGYMQSPRAACLALQDAEGKRRFLVPEDDADCDTYTDAMECDATWYEFADQPGPDLCLAETPACQPGLEAACVDGTGGARCAASKVCIPDAYCANCDDPSPTCFGPVGNSPDVTRLHCFIPANIDDTTQVATPCGSTNAGTLDLSPRFANGVKCTNVSFRAMLPPDLAIGSNDKTLPSGGNSQYALYIAPPAQGYACKFGVGWYGSVPAGFTDATHLSLLLSNGKRIAIDLRVTFRGNCSTGATPVITCELQPDVTSEADNIWSCAR